MKFYLTKAAQRAAESGQAPAQKEKVARAPKVVADKAPKISRVTAEKAPSARRQRAAENVAAAATGATVVATTAVMDAPAPAAVEAQPAGTSQAATPTVTPVRKEKRGVLVIGGQPRVDLLPLEVRAERKAGVQVRRAWLAVAAVVALVAVAGGAATLYAQNATASLTSAQGETATLSQEAARYSAVKTVQGQVDLIDAARLVGGSTDVDWPSYLAKVALTVPTGATLKDTTVDSASPVIAYAQASSPLQGQRIATLTLTATSSTLPSVPTWLDNLTKLPGYEDATAGTVTLADGVYTSTVTLHINKKAFSGFYTKGK